MAPWGGGVRVEDMSVINCVAAAFSIQKGVYFLYHLYIGMPIGKITQENYLTPLGYLLF